MLVKTAVLKIHNPSNHKRAVMDYAFKQYTLAFDYLLKLANKNLDVIINEGMFAGRLSPKNVRTCLTRIAGTKLNHFPIHVSLKESLIQDVTGSLLSYLELKKEDEKTSYPQARRIKHRDELHDMSLEQLKTCTILEDEKRLRDNIALSRIGIFIPMYFGRPDGVTRNRNFGLLHNPETDKYYAALYLLSGSSGRKTLIEPGPQLVPIHPLGGEWNAKGREASFIIVPLAFGEWHEKIFLEMAREYPKSIRSAYLNYKDGEYHLHVSFEFPVEKCEQVNILGIDRGIVNLAALTVVNPGGFILYQEEYSGKALELHQDKFTEARRTAQKSGKRDFGHKERRITEEQLHILANKIVQVAVAYKAQVVMEDLKRLNKNPIVKTPGRTQRIMNRRMGRTPYNKLLQILSYKLPLKGLKVPKLVDPRYTSQECPICEMKSRENRKSQDHFKCVRCEYETNADLNGSHNIARRWIWVINRAAEKRLAQNYKIEV